MDVANIDPGADFPDFVKNAVAECDVFIAIIGPHWMAVTPTMGKRRIDQWNDFVRIEIASALKQEKLVIPVLVGQAKMPTPTDLPEDIVTLARRNATELSHHRFAYDAEKLINSIKRYGRSRATKTPARKR